MTDTSDYRNQLILETIDVQLRRTDNYNLPVFLEASVIRQLCSFFRKKSKNNVI